MGNVERCDKTLPTNEMMYHIRKDATLRARFVSDLAAVAREFGLSQAEYEAIRDLDSAPHDGSGRASVLRALRSCALFGTANNSNSSAALERYQRAYPEETAGRCRAQGATRREELMAQIVAAMAMTHAPGMTGWFTQAPRRPAGAYPSRNGRAAAAPRGRTAGSGDHVPVTITC